MNTVVIPDFMSPAECDTARALFPVAHEGTIETRDSTVLRTTTRRSRVAFLPVDTKERRALVEKVRHVLYYVNDRHFRFDISGVEPLQLARYEAGDHYRKHLDLGPGPASLRKLSASVQLSDPADYDGGSLVIWCTGSIDRARGTLVAFPSHMVHEVEPVTRGTRYSLVGWAIGERAFR